MLIYALYRSVAHLWAGDTLKNDWIMEMYNWIGNYYSSNTKACTRLFYSSGQVIVMVCSAFNGNLVDFQFDFAGQSFIYLFSVLSSVLLSLSR